jgi:alkylated DNA repair dioxygenase AlkB
MNTLFPVDPVFPEGFSYSDNFLDENEEEQLYKDVLKIDLHNFNFQGYTANRKTASFGFDYSFDNRKLTKGKEIPSVFNSLIDKVAQHISTTKDKIAELLIIEYPVGAVINWHRDAPPFDIIIGISLLSDCKFRLRPQDKLKQNRGSIISFPVKRRSMYVMEGSSRSEWQHSISPVKEVRYSITLRTLRE